MSVFVCIVLLILAIVFLFGKSSESVPSGGGDGTIIKGGVNNPGFLKVSRAGWLGSSHAENQTFENFTTIQLGARAWYINLLNKVKKGTIRSTTEMIDVLTPAGEENSEIARNNYKASVKRAQNWAELGKLVFDFEGNPDWRVLTDSEKATVISQSLLSAIQYCGNVPFFSN